SCAAKGSCSAMGTGEEMEVQAINVAGAKVGDTVVFEVQSSSVLKLSFLLYIFPILSLMLGAFVGSSIALRLNYNQTTASVGLGLLFLLASFLYIKIIEKPLSQKQEYQPKIIRILTHA
ncbi:MAG: SoxR reducing system RseC family protein, partial [Dehalococcoidia bacterium]|nr:SoxR reducing system RseC family protein [Dehalococcoidia bacterium]